MISRALARSRSQLTRTLLLLILLGMSAATEPALAMAGGRGADAARALGFQQGDLSLDCPDSVRGGGRVEVTLSGSGFAVVDANSGTFPAEAPNTDFAKDADGGTTLIGELPAEGGSADLVWVAPEVAETQTVYLFATDENGNTPGECAVEVTAAGDGEANADSTPGDGAEPTAEPTAKKSDKPKKTPTPEPPTDMYSEVRGLPGSESAATEEPDTDGTEKPNSKATEEASPTPSPTRTPSTRPTATFAPTTSDSGMVAIVIGPDGGTLECDAGATVRIPAGAVAGPVTLTILPLADSKFPSTTAIQFVPGTGFDVTVAGEDGRALTTLGKRATVRIKVDAEALSAGAKLYRVDGLQATVIDDAKVNGDMLEARVDGFSRYVVGIPQVAAVANKRSLLPFILAAIVVLMVLAAMVVLGGMFRPRRQRVMINTRRPSRTVKRR